jgi:carboxypeptidase T
MKKLFTLLFLLPILMFAQNARYSKVKVYADERGIMQLAELGICVDHGELKKGFWFVSDFSAEELSLIKSAGFKVDILIQDVQAYYENQNTDLKTLPPLPTSIGCLSPPVYPTPTNFTLGTMGGFFTYAQIQAHLDNMFNLYPSLIKQKIALPINSIEGRPVYWLKISDNPNVDENEPELLYTAVHHAREPASVAQLIMYMYYLLENYATNPEVQYLVNNSEMYFVPLVNPDGYVYNQTTNPNGGGMWRKNRRNNGDGTYGIDLNRNYGYNWGYDNSGSSPNTNSDTYRGTAAFSEPETQNLRDFCNLHQFKLCLNYHTYGNLLIYPWGYGNPAYTPDSAQFTEYGSHLTTYNKYAFGTAIQTVLYTANGISDDWMYGEQNTKPKIFAMTPEAGMSDEGFWPPQNRIIAICKENIWQNLHACHLVLKYAVASDDEPNYIAGVNGYLNYKLKRLGMEQPGTYTVTITPIGPEITSIGPPKVYSSLSLLQEISDSIAFSFQGNLPQGQIIKYLLEVDNGSYSIKDTITKRFGYPVTVFSSSCSNMTGFTSANWNTTTLNFWSSPSSITDSPGGNYSNNVTRTITTQSLGLTNAITAQLTFRARWETETNFDYVQVLASIDNGSTWTPVCGKYTKTGNGYEDPGQPVYDGFQFGWIKEEMSLDNFIGNNVLIRFQLKTDNGGTEDGFFFDDILIEKMTPSPVGTNSPFNNMMQLSDNIPNPADDYTYINYSLADGFSSAALTITNSLGQLLRTEELTRQFGSYKLNTSNLPAGVYFYTLNCGDFRLVKRMIVAR